MYGNGPGIPIFFKLWFALVGILAVAIIVVSITAMVFGATHPEALGEWVGRFLHAVQGTQ